ncbi:MAG: hypothetical protein SNJ52_03450 [Verrucomicrobiia bacterium]
MMRFGFPSLLGVLAWLFAGGVAFATQEENRPAARPAEVQRHGVEFEDWIRQTFFEGYQGETYTQKWDIPAEANRKYGGIPVNPKATKYRQSIGLGDALRQFDVDEPFLLVVGFWVQETPREKRFVKVIPVVVEPDVWRSLWHPIQRQDLERLDAVIKDRSISYREARRRAQHIKSLSPFREAIITVNPKIDSKGQRRLQCSLSFSRFFQVLAAGFSEEQEEAPMLWGVPVPNRFLSTPRGGQEEE